MKLPWKPGDPPALEEGAALADLWWPYAAGRKVLVIEEHPPYLHYLETLLRRAGYAVISATQAVEAVQKAREERPDVIVMDQKLPALRAFRSLDTLREDIPIKAIPVILVSLRNPGNFYWRPGDTHIGYAGRVIGLLDILRRLDLTAIHQKEAANSFPVDTTANVAEIQTRKQAKRILLSADWQHVVPPLKHHLCQAGYEVITCSYIGETIEQARTEQPDLIILDTLRQYGHWLSLFSQLRLCTSTVDIRLLLLDHRSAAVSSTLWNPSSSSAATFVIDPVGPSELLPAVEAALQSAPLRCSHEEQPQ